MKHQFISQKECLITELISENIIGILKQHIKHLLRKGEIKLNDEKIKTDVLIKKGDKISIFIPKSFLSNANDLINSIKIVYEDENILLCYKPKGMDCENNLVSIITSKYKHALLNHRLDRQTDGLVIFTLNKPAYDSIYLALKNQTIEKFYNATVKGKFNSNGTHTAYLTKNTTASFVKISLNQTPNSKKIISHFEFKKQKSDSLCMIEAKPISGRTHQLRAHLAFLGHPILGDTKYGTCKNPPLHLTAYKITFTKLPAPLEYLNGQTIKITPN